MRIDCQPLRPFLQQRLPRLRRQRSPRTNLFLLGRVFRGWCVDEFLEPLGDEDETHGHPAGGHAPPQGVALVCDVLRAQVAIALQRDEPLDDFFSHRKNSVSDAPSRSDPKDVPLLSGGLDGRF